MYWLRLVGLFRKIWNVGLALLTSHYRSVNTSTRLQFDIFPYIAFNYRVTWWQVSQSRVPLRDWYIIKNIIAQSVGCCSLCCKWRDIFVEILKYIVVLLCNKIHPVLNGKNWTQLHNILQMTAEIHQDHQAVSLQLSSEGLLQLSLSCIHNSIRERSTAL
jgi:hypothetical protein